MLIIYTYHNRVTVRDDRQPRSQTFVYIRRSGESDQAARINAVADYNRRYAPVVTIGQRGSVGVDREARLTRPATTGDN